MRSYFATQGSLTYANGWYGVIQWAKAQLHAAPVPVKILTARPDSIYATIVAEVTEEWQPHD